MRNAENTLLVLVRWLARSKAYTTAPTGGDWVMHTNAGQLRLARARISILLVSSKKAMIRSCSAPVGRPSCRQFA